MAKTIHSWTIIRHDRPGSAWLLIHSNTADSSTDSYAFTSLEHARKFVSSKRGGKRIRFDKKDDSHYRYIYKD